MSANLQAPDLAKNEIAAKILVETVNKPLDFVEAVYPWGVEGTVLENKSIRDWQRDELIAIGEHLASPTWATPYRSSTASGHGIGKSTLIAWLIHWGITTMVDAVGVVTANTESQLRTKTWPEMRKWYAMLAVKQFFRPDNTVFRSNDPNFEDTWRFDAIPWSANNTEAFAGLHNEGKRIVLLYDEGSAIDDKIWEVSEGALTDMDTQILWVVFGNPTRPVGRFYQTHNIHRHRWRHRQIDSRTVEGTNKQQMEEWVEDYGEDSDFVRVRVRGMFPRSGSNQLISTETVMDAQARDEGPRVHDPLIFGLDVAREGTDESVLQTRKGCAAGIHGTFKWRGLNNVQLAREVAAKIIELKPHHVFIDGGGPGGGVVDILRDLHHFDVTEVSFGSSPHNPDYANKRAEMWCDMRDWLRDKGCIPWNDTDLANELTNQTYHYRENKAQDLILTPKKLMKADGLPSPDNGDALALTFAELVQPVTHPDSSYVGSSDTAETDYDEGWN